MHRTSILACAAAALSLAAAPAGAARPPTLPEPPPAPPGFPAGPPGGTMLVTGDSMMTVLERALAAELSAHGAGVRMDARIGSGITKPFLFDWVAYARRQATLVAPSVTIVFLGAGDVYPIRVGRRDVRCCGRAWQAAYERRARRMVRAWLRGGQGRVYWLTLPTPRDRRLARVHRAIDRAVARAVARAGPGAAVVDLVPVFTPGRRFRRAMPWAGRSQVVRQLDGIHLAPAGARIAAGHVRRALQRDALL
jgi:hypothetical protein